MGDEESLLRLSRSGEACGAEQRGKWVERSASKDDSLSSLVWRISRDSL